MKSPYPCPTKEWHNNVYESISPFKPELSAAGKTVVVVGAGSGIGRETAAAFGSAGAEKLVLIGRTESSLVETKGYLPTQTEVNILVADISQPESVQKAAAEVGTWQVLVLTAAFTASASPFGSGIKELSTSVDTNIKGVASTLCAFQQTADPNGASLVSLTSASTFVPTAFAHGLSSYVVSKLAQAKLIEFFTAENAHIFAANVHPGFIDTASFAQTGADKDSLPMDHVKLPASFIVWLASPEGEFLRGKSVWANWDVDELKSMANEIQAGPQMTAGVVGWPFQPPS